MAMMSGAFPFYNPGSRYGWDRPYDHSQSPLGHYYLNNTAPEAAFTRWLSQQGYGGMDSRSNFMRGLYGRTAAGYGAALGTNPDLDFTTYLTTIDPERLALEASPQQRGERGGHGPMRWAARF